MNGSETSKMTRFNRFEKVWKKDLSRNLISVELYKVVGNQTSRKIHKTEANITLESGKNLELKKDDDLSLHPRRK